MSALARLVRWRTYPAMTGTDDLTHIPTAVPAADFAPEPIAPDLASWAVEATRAATTVPLPGAACDEPDLVAPIPEGWNAEPVPDSPALPAERVARTPVSRTHRG